MQRVEGMETGVADEQSTEEWLKSHSVEYLKLTLKDLVIKGAVGRCVSVVTCYFADDLTILCYSIFTLAMTDAGHVLYLTRARLSNTSSLTLQTFTTLSTNLTCK